MYVIRASNDLLRDYVYRLRHRVYCIEFGYAFVCGDGREVDMDDSRSVHVLAMRYDGGAVGTGRIILPEVGVPLPTERVLDSTSEYQMSRLPSKTTEISRFTLLKEFRTNEVAIRLLMQGLVDIGIDYGMTDAIAVMQPAFLRYLRRFGIRFNPLGGLIEHHGIRQPCWISVQDLIDAVGSTSAAA
jgi:N-acyl-L-homoserine lactone synthetase